MPFIYTVIRNVLPFVDRSLITVSKKSNDGTLRKLDELQQEFPERVFVDYEDVSKPGDLTYIRQMQIGKTVEDWILFLDDDDYWPSNYMDKIKRFYLNRDVDAYAVNPYQVINGQGYDISWRHKWFTKLFRNKKGLHYRKEWPRDIIFIGNDYLYWRANKRVERLMDIRYFHLSNVKHHSFRKEGWAKEFDDGVGEESPYPDYEKDNVLKIMELVKNG